MNPQTNVKFLSDINEFEGPAGTLCVPNSAWEIIKQFHLTSTFMSQIEEDWVQSGNIFVAPKNIFKFAGMSERTLKKLFPKCKFPDSLFVNNDYQPSRSIFSFTIGPIVPPIYMFAILYQRNYRLALFDNSNNSNIDEIAFLNTNNYSIVPITIFQYCNNPVTQNTLPFLMDFAATMSNAAQIKESYDLTRSYFER